jgi:hypothetical protein
LPVHYTHQERIKSKEEEGKGEGVQVRYMQAGMSREKGRAKTEKKRKEEKKRGREEEKTYLEHRRERGADRIHVVPPAD